MAKIQGLRFDVIECEQGWQVECTVGPFTCYSVVNREVEGARQLARDFAKLLGRHPIINDPAPADTSAGEVRT